MISNITETTASQVKDLVWYTRSPLLYYELLSPKGRYFLLVIFSFFFHFLPVFGVQNPHITIPQSESEPRIPRYCGRYADYLMIVAHTFLLKSE